MNNNLVNVTTLPPFKKLCMTIGELPTSYLESMTYPETLIWLCNYLSEVVIPALNNNGEAVEELQAKYVELKSYVDDYFDNLDVQEEINNKLDEMAQDGSLETLIGVYIQPRIDEQNVVINNLITNVGNELQEFNAKLNAATSGSPKGVYSTVSALETADPDHDYIYVVSADGKWYYYDSTEEAWTEGGTYQGTEIDPDEPVILSKLDKQQVLEPVVFTTESGIINTSKQVYAGANFEHTVIENVTGGSKYYVSGVSTNTSYVGAFCDKPGTGTQIYIQDTATAFTDLEVTIPNNLDGGSLYVNGYISTQPVNVKTKNYQDSDDFWDEFNEIKNRTSILEGNICARRDGNNIYFFKHGYKADTDLTVWFKRKASNSLMDFYGWFTSTNESDNVITSLPDAYSRTQLIAGDTDFLSPTIVYATSNINGDFANYTAQKFTGGWHGYNNATSGASATASEVSCNLYVDGTEVTNGNYKVGKKILLKIVNNLQGSNTEKEDGTGREILQQIFYIRMNDESNKITVDCELKPLESVIISRHYGISFYRANISDYGYFLNSNNVHAKNLMSAMVTNAEKTTSGFMEVISARNSIFTMERNVLVDLGKGYANKRDYGQLLTGGKVYNIFVNCTDDSVETNGLSLTANDIVRWSGYYDINPVE